MTLGRYVRRRTGVPMGARGSLGNMLQRSLGAGTFAGFWRHWNPIFGYGLGRYVFKPLRRGVPVGLALVLTFGVCGALHDLMTLVVRGGTAGLFTWWFLVMGLGVLLGRAVGLDLTGRPWLVRAAANVAYVGGSLAAVLLVRNVLSAGA